MRAAKAFRSILFWVHLCVGVVAGLIILTMSATGVVLTYERQITAWAMGGTTVTPPSADAPRLPVDSLIARVVASSVARGGVVGVTVPADPTRPVVVSFADRRSANVNPYTGEIFTGGAKTRAFFATVTSLHRWMGMTGDNRTKGKSLTGTANLFFLFLLLTGIYLWFPRQWSVRAYKAVAVLNLKAKGKARDWNWHHVFGLWLGPVLLVVIVSGTFLSYAWPRTLVNNVFGTGQAAEAGAREGREGGRNEPMPPLTVSVDQVIANAKSAVPGWQTIQLRFPRREGAPLTAVVSEGLVTRPDVRSQLTFDNETAELRKRESYDGYDTARKITSWMRTLHTGEAGGLIGQTVAGLASLAGVLLVVTGFSLAIRRLAARLRRNSVA